MSDKPIAESLAAGQKEISVAEFFERNRQILGFDSPTKALITSVKEAVDNALDACEEANILPEIRVELNPTKHKEEFEFVVEDNGPGVVQRQIPNIFARLLYGSRFHAIRQSRGQQGIGISAVVLYGQITTGTKATVTSKIGKGHPAVRMKVSIDTKRNLPLTHDKEILDEFDREHGTRIETKLKGRYVAGSKSVLEYLRGTSIVNPHAKITFQDPNGEVFVFERAAEQLPRPTISIKPHPRGIELGHFMKMAEASEFKRITTFLQKDFSSVGATAAKAIIQEAGLPNIAPQELELEQMRRLMHAFEKVKILAPPMDCLSPIGENLVRRGLKKETEDISPEYITTVTRPPSVWGGHPFQVEVGIVYGGSLPKDQSVKILRFANRVPLMYQNGACEGTLGVQGVDWRRYGLEQRGGKGTPNGPAIILVHIASTKVPFTSEAKEAIAPMEEIHKEIRLALMDAARGLGRHLKKRERRAKVSEKFTLVQKILPEIARKSASMLNKPEPNLAPIVCKIMDVVWIDDSKGEYVKLPKDEIEAANAPKPKAAVVAPVVGGSTLDAWNTPAAPVDEDFEDEDFEIEAPSPEEQAVSEPKGEYRGDCVIPITSYRMKVPGFRLYVVLPEGAEIESAEPPVSERKNRWIAWDLPALQPTQQLDIKFHARFIGKGDLDNIDTYIEGINELHVVGADKWQGGES